MASPNKNSKARRAKVSLHSFLTDRGWADDRDQAERVIRAGLVRVNDALVDKPGTQIRRDAKVDVLKKKHGFVSRGGLKMEAALTGFRFKVEGLRCLDVGIGTGGFSDCLLQHGAAELCGVDVGYGDVAWKLRQDSRVTLFERSNFRVMDLTLLRPPFDLVVVDCSFISLELLLENLALCVREGGALLTLIKPQFEAKREQVEDGGVVLNEEVRAEVCARMERAAHKHGFHTWERMLCPVAGQRSKNHEWLVLFGRVPDRPAQSYSDESSSGATQ